jgi:hypothetical protein
MPTPAVSTSAAGQSLFSLAVQNASPMNLLGVVTSASQFFRQIGATIGVAVFGTLLTHNLNQSLGGFGAGVNVAKLQAMAMTAEPGAAPVLPQALKVLISDAITDVFFIGLFVVAIAFFVVWLIPALPMKERAPPKEAVVPADAHV